MPKNELSAVDFMKKRYKDVRRLVDMYGVEGVRLAVDQCAMAIEDEKQVSKGGRPAEYGPQNLMQLWLYVEEQMARTKRSASSVCRDKKARFDWVTGGKDRWEIKQVSGNTLLRRYQEAKAFLEAVSDPYRDLAKKGVKIKLRASGFWIGAGAEEEVGPVSPTEQMWRKELEHRLSQKVVRKLPPKT